MSACPSGGVIPVSKGLCTNEAVSQEAHEPLGQKGVRYWELRATCGHSHRSSLSSDDDNCSLLSRINDPAGNYGGGDAVGAQTPPLARLGRGSQEAVDNGDLCDVVPHTPPPACLGRGSLEGGKGGELVNKDGGDNKDARLRIGNSEVPTTGVAPLEGIKSNPDTTVDRGSNGDGMNEGSRDTNKVASSSTGGGGFFNEGGRDSNKVVSSSICGSGTINEGGEDLHEVGELEGGSTFSSAHARVK